MQKTIYTILILTTFLISCSDSVKKAIVKNENGVVVKEYSYKGDSIIHGEYKSYDEDGVLFEEANYVDGVLEGPRQLFFVNGKKEIEETYVNGELHGPYLTFYESGNQNIISEFVNGRMTGLVKRYYDSGGIMEEVNFVDNEENGPFKEYYENGQLEWEGNYLNGDNEFGLLVNYDEAGELIKKMQCDSNAICQTIWTPETGDIPLKILFENN